MTTCDLCTFTPQGVKQCPLCKLADDCLEDVTVLDGVLAEQYPQSKPARRIGRRIH